MNSHSPRIEANTSMPEIGAEVAVWPERQQIRFPICSYPNFNRRLKLGTMGGDHTPSMGISRDFAARAGDNPHSRGTLLSAATLPGWRGNGQARNSVRAMLDALV